MTVILLSRAAAVAVAVALPVDVVLMKTCGAVEDMLVERRGVDSVDVAVMAAVLDGLAFPGGLGLGLGLTLTIIRFRVGVET